jgi:hypothetical protein
VQLVPRNFPARALALLWLLLCFAVLVFGFVQRSIHDMPVAFIWFMIFLSFPVGFVVAFVFGLLISTVGAAAEIPYVPFWHELPFWLAAVAAGYLQWFVLLPALMRFVLRAWRRR